MIKSVFHVKPNFRCAPRSVIERTRRSPTAFIFRADWCAVGPNPAHRMLKGLESSNPTLSASEYSLALLDGARGGL